MNEWHYPRPELAQHYLQLITLGISSSLAIIAPRRKGKTLFILQDLVPFAQRNKFLPIYASLWQNINAPHEGIITALEEAIENLDSKLKFNRLLDAQIKKTTLSNELIGSMEVEFATNPSRPSPKELSYLEKLMGQLEKKAKGKTILLLIDEVQHLVTSKEFESLTHTLRTMLDKRQGRVKSIFTGSSRHYMNILFNESQSPFYHFVETLNFPDLDEKFIEFLRKKLATEYGIITAIKPLKDAFIQLDYSPYWIMKMISQIITFKINVPTAFDHIQNLIEIAEQFEYTAKKLKPIDCIIFLALCDKKNPFSKELLREIDTATEIKGIASNIQRSIKRLSEMQLISQIRKGEYYIEKPGLKNYLVQIMIKKKLTY
ncbi:MAG: hypothetical protein V4629_09285 [Pseudomonadota bacterium]